jgi:integrase
MPHASLSEAFCKRLFREAKDLPVGAVVDYFSIDVKKFSLRILGPSKQNRRGLLSWRFAPGRFDGGQPVLTFGHYPILLSDEAHLKARKAQVLLYEAKLEAKARKKQGLPPEKQNPWAILFPQPEPLPTPAVVSAPVDTVKAMFERYKPELDEKSDNTRRNTLGFFTRYILPAWGERSIHSLTKREIVDLLKVVKIKSGPIAANRGGSDISAWLNFLVRDGVLEVSPATKLPRNAEKPREQVLTVPQLVRVWQAGAHLGGPAGRFLQFLISTPVRRNEAAGLQRSEVDRDKQDCLLPVNRHKSGRRTGHDFWIPLQTLAVSVLDACPDTGRFYFSVSGRRPISGFTVIKAKLDAIIGEQGKGLEPLPHWTFHDIRRSVSSHLAALGVTTAIREKVLNHAPPRLEATYDRYSYAAEKRQALQLWSDHFSAALANPHYNAPELEAAE